MQNLKQQESKEENLKEKQYEQVNPNQFNKRNEINEPSDLLFTLMHVGLNGIDFTEFSNLEKCHFIEFKRDRSSQFLYKKFILSQFCYKTPEKI